MLGAPGLRKPDGCPAGPGHTSTRHTLVQTGWEVLPAPHDPSSHFPPRYARHWAQSRGLPWAGSEGSHPQQLPSADIQDSPAPKPSALLGAQSAPGRPHMLDLGAQRVLIRTHPQWPLTTGLLEELRGRCHRGGGLGAQGSPPPRGVLPQHRSTQPSPSRPQWTRRSGRRQDTQAGRRPGSPMRGPAGKVSDGGPRQWTLGEEG